MELLLPALGLFFWALLCFLVVFFILRKTAWKPILQTLHDRENSIAESIATADKVRKEMENQKAENEQVLAAAREERANIVREAKEASNKMIAEAKQKASDEANKILADARAQIQNEKMAALTDVKNQVGKLVIEVSEKVLRKELSDKANQESYINTLAKEIKLN
jgi:F-type H+-transporting ATPase subunit b